jgi:hypothetical protein
VADRLALADNMTPGSLQQQDMADVSEERVPSMAADRALPVPDSIRIKNRRKRYLDMHPEYFGSDLELAGVLLNGFCSLTSRY